ncbi:MAG TPA: MBL fold metallo-hydrolase [Rhizomicrobium sp.]|jgi:cyclase|nr:MBL fold metallo-hydrolase [Rhizomicrobium sp.]
MRKFAFLAVLLALSPAAAQQSAVSQPMDFAKTSEQVVGLGHGLYAIIATNPNPASGIGDTTVAVGSDGLIVVDTQFEQLYPMLKARIAGISSLPVKYVINTHFHGDHTGGNAAFAKAGAIIMDHENVLKRMSAAKGMPKEALPAQTYSGQGTEVKVAGQTARLVHVENAHTDGDTVVFWPAANVISTGDIMHKPGYPNIDTASGGGIDGMIAATDYIIAHSDAQTKIVPGHGDVTDRAGAIAYRQMLATARSRIAAARAKGMTEDQVAHAGLLADLDKYWKIDGNGASERFPINVYRSFK